MVLITRKMDENISLNNKYMIYLNESFLIHVLLITVCLRTYYTIIYYYYQCVDTSAGGLLVPGCIIIPVVSVSITGSIPLLVDYQSLGVSSVQQSVFLSLVDTSAGGLLVPGCIISPVVSVSGLILFIKYVCH